MSQDRQDSHQRLEHLLEQIAATTEQRAQCYSIESSSDSAGARRQAAAYPLPVSLQQHLPLSPISRGEYDRQRAEFPESVPPVYRADFQREFASPDSPVAEDVATRRKNILSMPQQAAQVRTASRSANRRSPDDYYELVLAELQRHHGFDGDSILNVKPIKQKDLCKVLGLHEKQKPRISEVFKQLFGSQNDYCSLCLNRDKLLSKLQRLTGQKPEATGAPDRIDGLVGSPEDQRKVKSEQARR